MKFLVIKFIKKTLTFKRIDKINYTFKRKSTMQYNLPKLTFPNVSTSKRKLQIVDSIFAQTK